MRLGIALAISALLALPIPSQAQIIWDGDAIPSSLSGQPGDPIKGRTIVTSRQTGLCILCHAGPFPEERFQGNLAPDLKLSVANLSASSRASRSAIARVGSGDLVSCGRHFDRRCLL